MIYVAAVLLLLIFLSVVLSERAAGPVSYLPVNEEKTPVKPEGYKGTPIDKKNRFIFEEAPFYQNFARVFAFLPAHLAAVYLKRSSRLPVETIKDTSFLEGDDCIIWLGHASYFMRLNGKNLLIDPHFNNIYSYRRQTINPIDPDLFTKIDYLLLSHDHADHFDPGSIKTVIRNNKELVILTGMHMRKLIEDEIKMEVTVQENLWYEKFDVQDLEITFLPNRHYSKRIFRPFNSTLWGGYMISHKEGTIYWSGDSGYAGHFRTIGELFNPGLFIAGTGAYKPRWFMKDNHMNPSDAYQAYRDTGAQTMIPMHYGTFILGNETTEEVLKSLDELGDGVKKLTIGRIYPVSEL